MPSSLLVFILFAVLLSLHLHTFSMFFTLVYLIFIAAYLIAFTPHTVHNFEFIVKKKKKTDFGGLTTFWRGTFATVIHDTGSLLGQENTRKRIVTELS